MIIFNIFPIIYLLPSGLGGIWYKNFGLYIWKVGWWTTIWSFKPKLGLVNVIRTLFHRKIRWNNGFQPERSGRPIGVVSSENIRKVYKISLANRKMKLNVTADTLKISKERVPFILHKHLSVKKLFSKWENNDVSISKGAVWSCLPAIRRIFLSDSW